MRIEWATMMNDPWYELVSLELSLAVRAVVRMPAAFVGFQGHFPGRPILPGFAHVELAVDLLRRLHAGAQLAAVDSAKFTRSILPGEEISVELVPAGGDLAYDATLAVGGEVCSRFRLRLRQERAGLGR